MNEATLSALFTVDSSASDAYDGCTISSYWLVEDATGMTNYTSTEYVSYASGTGLSWVLNAAVDA